MSCRTALTIVKCSLVLALLSVAGCSRQDEITRYSVPRDPSERLLAKIPSGGAERSAGKPARILAAIVPRGRKTWFFKVIGPDAEVMQQRQRFTAFIRSVRFKKDAKEPVWDLPQGWQRMPGSGMRFASLQLGPPDKPLELTVIPLSTGGESIDEYLLANVNRWRGQLGRPSIASLAAEDSLSQLPLGEDTTATIVNVAGRLNGSDVAQAAATGALPPNHPPVHSAGASSVPGTLRAVPLTYTMPAGWSRGKVSGMRLAAFEIADGEKKAEVTVISLPAAGGDRLANVNRWRGQLQLGAISRDELGRALEPIKIDGHRAELVSIVGPAKQHDAILGAMVDRAGSTWFFKLKGSPNVVRKEKGRFRQFVRSVKFRGEKK
jgi:hypothetical protein